MAGWIHDALGGAFTLVAVVITWVLARRNARQQQLDEMEQAVRALIISMDQVVAVLRHQGATIGRPRYPRGW